jgi:MFS family permease
MLQNDQDGSEIELKELEVIFAKEGGEEEVMITKEISLEGEERQISQIRGWMIVLVSFFADALSLGGRALFMVVIVLWQSDKDIRWSVSKLSILMAIVHICNGLFTPVSGWLIDRFPAHIVIGCALAWLSASYFAVAFIYEGWQVWLFYGIMCGIGYGALNLNVFSVAVMKNLPSDRHGLAIGISTSGSTAGQLALVPLFAYTAVEYGWRASFIALSIAVLVLIIPAVILLNESNKDQKNEQNEENIAIEGEVQQVRDQVKEMNLSKSNDVDDYMKQGTIVESAKEGVREQISTLSSNPRYLILGAAFLICGITTTGFIESHIVSIAVEDNGLSLQTAAFCFSVLSAANGLAMIAAGALTDMYDRYYLLSILFFVRGVAFIILLWAVEGNVSLFFFFSVLFGLVDYSVVPPVVSLVKSYVPKGVGLGTGILLAVHSGGAAIGSSAGGILFEDQGNYELAILLCIVLCFAAAVMLFFARTEHK